MNYECEFRDFLMEQLQKKFNIYDETNLLLYLFLRYDCINSKKNATQSDFMQFVLHQLFIMSDGNSVSYDNIDFTFSYAQENSLRNIFDEWEYILFHASATDLNGNPRNTTVEKQKILDDIKLAASKKIQKYRNSIYKQEILKYFKLQRLNETFKIQIQEVPDFILIKQIDIRLTDEECLERYLHAEQFNTTNTKIITESSLRDYLFNHLDLIEAGLIPIGKEVATEEGRIDILAKDKHGNYVIIELKTEIDKRLVWQCLYYPEVLHYEYPVQSSVRVIAVCPEYPDYLLTVLKRLPQVELFQYQLHSTCKKIENIKIFPIK